MKYYIGVDGGGTKTQYALFDENKNIISSVKTSGSNHENLEGAIPEAAGIIFNGIMTLLNKNNIKLENITEILLALAGIDHDYQCKEMTEELQKSGLNVPFRVYNDGFIVVKAGLTGKAGIGYNCGTGTCCNSIDSDGNLLQIGGLDILTDDAGGGHWIARQVFIKIYDDICLLYKKTSMSELATNKLHIPCTPEGVLSIVSDVEQEKDSLVRTMIDVFFEALNTNDNAAEEIADVMALRGAQYINAHVKRQHFETDVIQVVLSGSIHTKLPSDKYIEKLISKTEELSEKKFEFIKLKAAPVTGCINWMLEK